MMSMGICVGAIALEISMSLHARATPALGDFSFAFFTVTGISLFAAIWNARLAPDAGVGTQRPIRPAPGRCVRP